MDVGALQHPHDRPRGDEPQRLGLPAAAVVADPGQRGQVGVAPQHQVGQRAAADVGGDHAVAGVAAGVAEAGAGVEVDGHAPVPRHRQRATPVVGDGRIRSGREVAAKHPLQALPHRFGALVLLADRMAQLVGRAAAADRDAAVGRALRVEEQVVAVSDQEAVPPAQLVPDLGRQRLGRDHQRVQRQVAQRLSRQLRGVGLGRAQHRGRAQLSARAANTAGGELQRRRALVDDHAQPLAGLGQAADQPGRVDAGAVRRVRGRDAPVDPRVVVGLLGRQRLPVLLGGAQRPRRALAVRQPPLLRCGWWRPSASRPSGSRSRCPPARSRGRSRRPSSASRAGRARRRPARGCGGRAWRCRTGRMRPSRRFGRTGRSRRSRSRPPSRAGRAGAASGSTPTTGR